MEQFALIMTHPPDQCPTANAVIRKIFLERGPEIPNLGKKLGVEFLAGPLITTEHKSISIVKANSAEAVRKFVLESGLIQWNSVEVLHGVSMERAAEEVNTLKPIY